MPCFCVAWVSRCCPHCPRLFPPCRFQGSQLSPLGDDGPDSSLRGHWLVNACRFGLVLSAVRVQPPGCFVRGRSSPPRTCAALVPPASAVQCIHLLLFCCGIAVLACGSKCWAHDSHAKKSVQYGLGILVAVLGATGVLVNLLYHKGMRRLIKRIIVQMMYVTAGLALCEVVVLLSCVFAGVVPSLQAWGLHASAAHSGALLSTLTVFVVIIQVRCVVGRARLVSSQRAVLLSYLCMQVCVVVGSRSCRDMLEYIAAKSPAYMLPHSAASPLGSTNVQRNTPPLLFRTFTASSLPEASSH